MRKILAAASLALVTSAFVGACTAGNGLVDGGPGDGGGADARNDRPDILGFDSGADGAVTTGTDHIDIAPFLVTCSLGLTGLTPASAFDSIQIRVTLDSFTDAGSGPLYTVQESRGTPCANAANNTACMASFTNAVVASSAWSTNAGYSGGAAPPPPRYAFYVVTHGDSVVTIANTAELAAFVAPVDTVTEAIDVRRGPLGGTSTCLRIRTDPDGYSFFEEGCAPFNGSGSSKTEVVTKVSRSGAVTTVQTAGPFPDPMGDCSPKP